MKLYATHGDYRIYLDSSAESGNTFYCRMGRFFADREVARELAEPLYDSATSLWLLATDAVGTICAFGCLDSRDIVKKGEALVTYGWVAPEHRNAGLHTAIFEARLRLAEELGARTVFGVANGRSHKTFERHGFAVVRVNGQYTYFRKELRRESV
jgi:GNAT superfamily N-acetyltransferase